MKPMSRKTAIREADKAFAKYIVARDKRCVTCGATGPLDCSHVFRRGHYSTRWNPSNAYAQCRKCHFKHHNVTESYLLDFAKQMLWAEAFEELRELSNTTTHLKDYQIEEIARYFRSKV
jgi:hypothetical protein